MRKLKITICEAKGKKVKVPKFKTSRDALDFLNRLGPDDIPSRDVIDPETGEVYWYKGQRQGDSKRQQGKRLARGKHAADALDRVWAEPSIHFSGYDDYEAESEMEDFYNIVYKRLDKMVPKSDHKMMAQADYDLGHRPPVLVKRKDKRRFTETDAMNVRNFIQYWSERMGNITLMHASLKPGMKMIRMEPAFT